MHIELHRAFRELRLDQLVDDTSPLVRGGTAKTLGDLLALPRVVILSEGGTGKTWELKEACRRLRGEGKAAFFLRLENVAREFDSAFDMGTLAEFRAWLGSEEPGWLLLDSIDESRLRSPQDFEQAMRSIGNRLSGAMDRIHLVVTGRPSAWRPRSDLAFCDEKFPVDRHLTRAMTSEVGSMDQAASESGSNTGFKVMALEDLSDQQARLYAKGMGVENIQSFLDAIDRADARAFRQRPQDLDELVAIWREEGRIASGLDLMRASVARRLHDSQDRVEARPLSDEKAIDGARRIAGALALVRVQNIRVPDGLQGGSGLDARVVLDDWSAVEVTTLLQRSLFEPDVYGTVRFHHRSVMEYLAAQWFLVLLARQVSRRNVEELFFREEHGMEVAVPSLRRLLPWLVIEDVGMLDHMIRVAPEVVFEGGDPLHLPLDIRAPLLRQACEQIASQGVNGSMAYLTAVQRFAAADLLGSVRLLASEFEHNDEVSYFLMNLIWQGRLEGALDAALKVASAPARKSTTRIAAIKAIGAVGTARDMAIVRGGFAGEVGELDRDVMTALLEQIELPNETIVDWMIDCVARLAPFNPNTDSPLTRELESFMQRADQTLLARVVDQLYSLLYLPRLADGRMEGSTPGHRWLKRPLAVALRRLITACDPAALEPNAVAALHSLASSRTREPNPFESKGYEFGEPLANWPDLKWRWLWHAVEAERLADPSRPARVVEPWMAIAVTGFDPFKHEDFDAAIDAIRERAIADDKEVALAVAFTLYIRANRPPAWATRIDEVTKAGGELHARWLERSTPSESDGALQALERENARFAEVQALRSRRYERARTLRAARLTGQLDALRDPGFDDPSAISVPQAFMLDRMRELKNNSRNHYAIHHWRELEREFGPATALAFRDGMVGFWRGHSPALVSEGAELSSVPLADVFGLAGITVEDAETPGLMGMLSRDEAERAFRYAMREMNGFPPWFARLHQTHPDLVKSMALQEMAHELRVSDGGLQSEYLIADIRRVGDFFWEQLGPDVVAALGAIEEISQRHLEYLIDIVMRSKVPEVTIARLVAERSVGAQAVHRPLWIAAWMSVEPEGAMGALQSAIESLADAKARENFTAEFAARLIGSRYGSTAMRRAYQTPSMLKRLYLLIHEHVPAQGDIERAGRGVYTPALRDNAQDAREQLLRVLSAIPGRDTFLALDAISREHPVAASRPWAAALAKGRAEADSERPAWNAGQVAKFGRLFERAPTNHRELFDLAVLRLRDLKHELEDSDRSTAAVVIREDSETGLRNWIASWCSSHSLGRFVIPQEDELPGAKRPDLRWMCSSFQGAVPVELKIAENWTGPRLFERMEWQLGGDYLRDRASSHGIYLLVTREKGKRWMLPSGDLVHFEGFLAALRGHWKNVESAHPGIDRIEVIGIDLTNRSSSPSARSVHVESDTSAVKKSPEKASATRKSRAKVKDDGAHGLA